MSLSDLASLGSFVSGIAVLISLLYLALQVRQTEKNQRGTIANVRASRTVDVVLRGTDPSIATALQKTFGGAQDLTPFELRQFTAYAGAFLINSEDTFLQRRHGLLEDDAYRAYRISVSSMMANPAFRLAWRMRRHRHGVEFATFVDKVIAETPMAPPLTSEAFLAQWKSGWAELTQAV